MRGRRRRRCRVPRAWWRRRPPRCRWSVPSRRASRRWAPRRSRPPRPRPRCSSRRRVERRSHDAGSNRARRPRPRAGRRRPPRGETCATNRPMSSGRTRLIGWGSASIIVTSWPRPRQVAATSAPMKPAPITTTRFGSRSRSARRARHSSRSRSTCTPSSGSPGRVLGDAPMASTIPPASMWEPSDSVIVRRSTSRASARTPKRSSARSPPSSRAAGCAALSGSHSPDSTCLDSGGRSDGSLELASTITISPSWPASRMASTALRPASDAPMTTMGAMV